VTKAKATEQRCLLYYIHITLNLEFCRRLQRSTCAWRCSRTSKSHYL